MHASRLTRNIIIAMVLGVAIGLICQAFVPEKSSFAQVAIFGIVGTAGSVFIALLKMLVIPMVFVSLVCGTCQLKDPIKLGKIGLHTVLFYILSTAIAISMALMIASFFHIGQGMNMTLTENFKPITARPLGQVILDMFPSNPIHAMSEGQVLPVIIYAIFIGIALAMAGPHGRRISAFFSDLEKVLLKLVTLVIAIAPLGVFFLLIKVFYQIDPHKIHVLLGYFLTVIFILFLQCVVVYSAILWFFARMSPWHFIKKFYSVMIFGFSTSSSYATLPITLKAVKQKLKVPERIASFVVPLGATINMDGTAIMQGTATIFIANIYDIHLSLGQLCIVVATATLSSIGTAGVPSVGLITLVMVLEQVGIPVAGIALIIGIDRLLDMVRTAVNVCGDAVVACAVAKLNPSEEAKPTTDSEWPPLGHRPVGEEH